MLEATSKVSYANGVATAKGSSTVADLVIKAAGITIPVALGVGPNTTINVLDAVLGDWADDHEGQHPAAPAGRLDDDDEAHEGKP